MRSASSPGHSYQASGGSSSPVPLPVGSSVLSPGLAMSGPVLLVFLEADNTAFRKVLSLILPDLDKFAVGVVGTVLVLGLLELERRLWSGGSDTSKNPLCPGGSVGPVSCLVSGPSVFLAGLVLGLAPVSTVSPRLGITALGTCLDSLFII